MFSQQRQIKKYRRKGRNFIAANKIKPEQWHISNSEAKEALKTKGYKIKQIKKIHCLKHQVCISYWDAAGNICSSFFSYRIFGRWQQEVEKLIYTCQTLKEWTKVNYVMKHELAYYNYPSKIEDALRAALENRLHVLKVTLEQAVYQNFY
ncbi:hypothetical protein IQ276_015280 [Desmonostoc muscorum LEGE 12446]|uniref:Uncharacterized protein n=1 Tax=Desmonostoc muscorum LEGE 12446 TaxID=1828758 RepID=A0A8J7A6S2_DESMC|nr:hypothetical protein [Desmonostoc muscorum]MCF2147757.1 hypothetical protein [Desmonostoc muscorum LEGE 12446]